MCPEIWWSTPRTRRFSSVTRTGRKTTSVCRLEPGFSWISHGPQATLYDGDGEQQMTHFLSANPVENRRAARHVAALPRLQRRLGVRDRDSPRARARCDSLAEASGRWRCGRTDRRSQAEAHDIHPTREHRRRIRASHRLRGGRRRRQKSAGAVHDRLRVLPPVIRKRASAPEDRDGRRRGLRWIRDRRCTDRHDRGVRH